MRKAFQQEMWVALGIVCSREGLEQGLRAIDTQRARLQGLALGAAYEFEAVAEMEAMCDAAEAICRAALHRTESRGAHYREDFPQRDDARWIRTVVVARDPDGRVQVSHRPIEIPEHERISNRVGQAPMAIKGEFTE